MAQESHSSGASWVAWGVAALLAAAAVAMLLLLLTAHRADAALLPEPVSGAIEGVTGPTTAPSTEGGLTEPVTTIVSPVVQTVAPVVDPVVQTVTPVVDPVLQTGAPLVQAVVQTIDPATGAVVQVLQPIVAPVVETLAPALTPVGDLVVPLLTPVTNIVELGAPRSANLSPSAVATPGDDHAAPPAPPSSGAVGDAGPIASAAVTASRVATGATGVLGVPDAPPVAPNDGPMPASPLPAPLNGLDTSRVLELLLYAVAATFAAHVFARGRRVLQFGAVKPRLAFVSLIERPG